jgi:hypothetical protein
MDPRRKWLISATRADLERHVRDDRGHANTGIRGGARPSRIGSLYRPEDGHGATRHCSLDCARRDGERAST